jgi:hypothetical protein
MPRSHAKLPGSSGEIAGRCRGRQNVRALGAKVSTVSGFIVTAL